VRVIAALFVRADGPYAGRDDVDAWPAPMSGALFAVLERDARAYAGPWPVVAHPPCKRWSRLAAIHAHRWPIGSDDGCFAAALASVERWGGVLEHPCGTFAWPAFGLAKPRHGAGWTPSRKGWVCSVDQGRYGHPARKRTWLYYVGAPPRDLDWAEAPVGERSAIAGCVGVERQAKSQRELTPPAFVAALLDLARRSPVSWPAWVRVDSYTFWCRIHGRQVADCDCDSVEDWPIDPYAAGGDPPDNDGDRDWLIERLAALEDIDA